MCVVPSLLTAVQFVLEIPLAILYARVRKNKTHNDAPLFHVHEGNSKGMHLVQLASYSINVTIQIIFNQFDKRNRTTLAKEHLARNAERRRHFDQNRPFIFFRETDGAVFSYTSTASLHLQGNFFFLTKDQPILTKNATMDPTSPPAAPTEAQSPTYCTTYKDLEQYDLIIGRRGCKGHCSKKVQEWLFGWFPKYVNTKQKSTLLQEQVYPEFVRNHFQAYSKNALGEMNLESDKAKIIAKLKKEMDLFKTNDKENDSSRKRKVVLGSTPPKTKRKAHRNKNAQPSPQEQQEITLDGEDLLLQAYMDEIPVRPTGLGPNVSTSTFRSPGFHFLGTPAPANQTPLEANQAFVKDIFPWQDFESYSIPPSLGQESGSPTTSTILRAISSSVYVSPETVPESQSNGTFTAASLDNMKQTVTWADKTTPLNQQSPCGIDPGPQLPFLEESVSDSKDYNQVTVDTHSVFDVPSPIAKVNPVVDSNTTNTQEVLFAPPAGPTEAAGRLKTKISKPQPKAVPRFVGPSPISFQVLNPYRRKPQLAPKPPSLVDMVIGIVKQLENRAEALERENTAVWKRLHELELKYEMMLPSSKEGEDEKATVFQV
jgi:hypothetical protein